MTLFRWDKTTPGNNATADSTIGWSEGQAPSSVNDSARAMMTAVAKYRDDIAGSITTGGTSTAYTVTTNQVFTTLALMNNAMIAFIPHTNCGATVTLNVDGLGAKPLRTSPGVELAANSLIAGTPYAASYVNASAVWYLQNVYNIPAAASSIITSMIADDNVTYAKIQNVTNNRLLGNFSGGAADVSEYAVAGGIGVSGSTLSFGLPPAASFKNLSIKVLTNTTIAVAADFVVMYDSTNVPRTAAISGTIDMTTSAVVNGRDGSLAIDTWYYIWAISNGTTDGALASTSATAPTLPSGYTFKARIGAVQTIHASTALYGTWQLGRRGQYVVGLASTANLPSMISGASGSVSIPTWTAVALARFVPTTASEINLTMMIPSTTAANVMVAPNNSYGVITSSSNPAPFSINQATSGNLQGNFPFDFLLESTNIYYASTNAGNNLFVVGWLDNI